MLFIGLGVPGVSRKEAHKHLLNHKDFLSREFVMKVVQSKSRLVQLLDDQQRLVNAAIAKIVTGERVDSDLVEGVCGSDKTNKVVKNQWNEKLFVPDGLQLSPEKSSCYQTLQCPNDEMFRVLHFKSPSQFFLCSKDAFQNLQQFQVLSDII